MIFVASVHAMAAWSLAGLIWFVQVVHYPLFAEVGAGAFSTYEVQHVRRTTRVVAPLMLVEAGTALWLFVSPPQGSEWATWLGFALLVVVWLSTALAQVPCHRRLERGLDHAVVRRLVAGNWIRTFGWTVRGVLALYVLAVALQAAGAV